MRLGMFFAFLLMASGGYAGTLPMAPANSGYNIKDDVLIRTKDGATLSATVVRKLGARARQPTLLTFDIHTDPKAFIERGKRDADHGYVGIIAEARGKRLSTDPVVPYEHGASDTDAAEPLTISWHSTSFIRVPLDR